MSAATKSLNGYGIIPWHWDVAELPEVVFFQEGPGLRKWQWTESGMKVINVTNILGDGRIDTNNTNRFISIAEYEKTYRHFTVREGDIVVASSGNTYGKVGRISAKDLPLIMNTSVIRFRSSDQTKLSDDFLYSFLRSKMFHNQVEAFVIGSAQPNFGPTHLKRMVMPLPPLSIQRSIAGILSAYDDLIENCQRRIEILEEMARSLYREWFVNLRYPGHESVPHVASSLGDIPQGWEVTTLGQHLGGLESGKRPKGGIREIEDGVPSIGAENINGIGQHDFKSEKFVPREFFKAMRKGVVHDRDVAIYKDGAYIGKSSYLRDGFPHAECCVNEHVFLLRSRGDRLTQNFLYLWLQEPKTVLRMRSQNSNAAQPGINQQTVNGLSLCLPDSKTAAKFDQLVEPLLGEVISLAKTIQNLRHTRNLLLPRLLSGQIDVEAMAA